MFDLQAAVRIVEERFRNVTKLGAAQFRRYTQQDLDDVRDSVIRDLTKMKIEEN